MKLWYLVSTMVFLISKWFGVFVVDDSGSILNFKLFEKKAEILKQKRVRKLKGEILDEEKEIIQDVDTVCVFEQRLRAIGSVVDKSQQLLVHIDPQKYGFSQDLLHDMMFEVSDQKTKTSLSKKDLQLIQMVNSFDDLTHILNLISERKSNWLVLPEAKKVMQPLLDSETQIMQSLNQFQELIDEWMDEIAPNISEVVGPFIGARLIAQSGGLQRLALMSSSTIQMLGAEKALFRFKKEGGKPPKHGIIFQHAHISRSPRNIRGRIARAMSSKISIAAKADAFTKNSVGEQLREQLDAQVEVLRQKK